MARGRIFGVPEDVYEYEFMIVKCRPDFDFDWIANFCFWNDVAEELLASNADYVMVHNVRIGGKELKKGRK